MISWLKDPVTSFVIAGTAIFLLSGMFSDSEISKVIDIMATTEDFKPNCCLVIIDFCVRHGFITPDEPGYVKLVQSLRVGND